MSWTNKSSGPSICIHGRYYKGICPDCVTCEPTDSEATNELVRLIEAKDREISKLQQKILTLEETLTGYTKSGAV